MSRNAAGVQTGALPICLLAAAPRGGRGLCRRASEHRDGQGRAPIDPSARRLLHCAARDSPRRPRGSRRGRVFVAPPDPPRWNALASSVCRNRARPPCSKSWCRAPARNRPRPPAANRWRSSSCPTSASTGWPCSTSRRRSPTPASSSWTPSPSGLRAPAGVDPARYLRELERELILNDLAIVESRLQKLAKEIRVGRKEGEREHALLVRLKAGLEAERPRGGETFDTEDTKLLRGFPFLPS